MSADLLKLRNVQNKYEKDLQSIKMYVKHFESEEIGTETNTNESEFRGTEAKSYKSEIKEIAHLLKGVKNKLFGGNIGAEPKMIKERMMELQQKILNIKNKNSDALKTLLLEETYLYKDVQIYEDKIAEWTKPINIESLFGRSTIKTTHTCKEVNDFFEFLTRSGGPTNGWNQDDHNLFLKVRSTMKSKRKFVEVLHRKIPYKTEPEIEKHEDWYLTYLRLKNNKIIAIKKWKSEKKEIEASPVTDVVIMDRIGTKVPDYDKRNKIKDKLNEWKKEKEDRKLLMLHLNENQRLRQSEKEKQKGDERKAIKTEIDHWKFTKMYTKQLQIEQSEQLQKIDKKYREREANFRIKSFQAKDEQYVQRKLITRERSKSVEIQKSKKEAPRDPSRLLKPTKQWLNRRCNISYGNVNTVHTVHYINHVSRLAVPEWRKSLS